MSVLITYMVLFPCSECGHNNRVHKKVKNSLRLLLQDKLPPCKKCGHQMLKKEYHLSEKTPHIQSLKKELGLQ